MLISALKSFSEFLLAAQKTKEGKQQKKEEQKKIDEIDDVCDNGTLDDLLNLTKKSFGLTFFIAFGFLLCGCISKDPEIQATRPWENHYMNERDFLEGTRNIKLGRNESIWVLSNATLSRMIKDLKNNNH